ncbi:MAG: hypothetical protein V1775_02730 [Bacteroidota bacterium]
MSIKIGDYDFEGPFLTTNSISDVSGVYSILCYKDSLYSVIDIGESATLKTRLDTHDRRPCWKNECKGTIYFSVLYTPYQQQAGRMEIEQELRDHYNPPCGKR